MSSTFNRYLRGESQEGLLSAQAFGHEVPFRLGAGEGELQRKALLIVGKYVQDRLDKTDPDVKFDVFVVWFSKTLQNWKTLISTSLPDGMYYEVTYNGDKREVYLDAYKKFDNVCIPDPE